MESQFSTTQLSQLQQMINSAMRSTNANQSLANSPFNIPKFTPTFARNERKPYHQKSSESICPDALKPFYNPTNVPLLTFASITDSIKNIDAELVSLIKKKKTFQTKLNRMIISNYSTVSNSCPLANVLAKCTVVEKDSTIDPNTIGQDYVVFFLAPYIFDFVNLATGLSFGDTFFNAITKSSIIMSHLCKNNQPLAIVVADKGRVNPGFVVLKNDLATVDYNVFAEYGFVQYKSRQPREKSRTTREVYASKPCLQQVYPIKVNEDPIQDLSSDDEELDDDY